MPPSRHRHRPYSIKPPLPSNHGAATTAVDHATAANLPRQRHIARPHLRSTAVARSAWLSAPPSIFGVVPPQALPVGAGGEFRQSSVTGAAGQNLATSTHSYPRIFFFARGTPISTPPQGATAATVICGGGTEERSSIGASPGHICSSTLAIPLPAAPPCRHAPSGYPSRLVKFACILCYPLLATKELDLVVILQKQGASSDLLHVLGDVDGVVHMRV
jgi:hypothetical protein